jgi:hypothetical protein
LITADWRIDAKISELELTSKHVTKTVAINSIDEKFHGDNDDNDNDDNSDNGNDNDNDNDNDNNNDNDKDNNSGFMDQDIYDPEDNRIVDV